MVPCTGSNSSVPAKASAVTISGLVRNDSVAALPSLRPGKLRLNEETMVLRLLLADVGRASTARCTGRTRWRARCRPIFSKVAMMPSRLMVW